jgi:CRISPR/Cas system-associated exonuclease Cas4 (RecB family)
MPAIPESIPHTVEAIYRTYENQPAYERSYLGASTFGTECDRAFWYSFRLAHEPEQLTGRKLRLFATGHREEERIIADLRSAGIEITGQQTKFSALGGHLKGHLDGIATKVPEAPKARHVLEVKTHNDKSFKALLKSGVAISKPGHYAQMQLYMHHTGIDRALYVAVNKNDDSLYVERVHYDKAAADRLIKRAERTINTDVAPSRMESFACAWCPAKAICLEGEFARRNCRTCVSATAIEGGWRCEHWNKDLTFAEQLAGCDAHLYLPSLVPGEQIDADEEKRTITYRLTDGREMVDGV